MNSKNATHNAPQGASWQEMAECCCDTPDLCRETGCAAIHAPTIAPRGFPRWHFVAAGILIFAGGFAAAFVFGLAVRL